MISRSADQISPKFGQHTVTISATYLFLKIKNPNICKNEGAVGVKYLNFYQKKFLYLIFFIFAKQYFLANFFCLRKYNFFDLDPTFQGQIVSLKKIDFFAIS